MPKPSAPGSRRQLKYNLLAENEGLGRLAYNVDEWNEHFKAMKTAHAALHALFKDIAEKKSKHTKLSPAEITKGVQLLIDLAIVCYKASEFTDNLARTYVGKELELPPKGYQMLAKWEMEINKYKDLFVEKQKLSTDISTALQHRLSVYAIEGADVFRQAYLATPGKDITPKHR